MNDEDKPNPAGRRAYDGKQQGWTEAALANVIAWFPDLPKAIKVIFASATIYLVLCLVAQVSPVGPFKAFGSAFLAERDAARAVAAEDRQREHAERADLIALLMEQNRELRAAAAGDPDLEPRVRLLERKMDALLDTHPKERLAVEGRR